MHHRQAVGGDGVLRVRGEEQEHRVLQDDGKAEGDQQRRLAALAHGLVQQGILEPVAQGKHQGHRHQQAQKRIHPQRGRQQRGGIGAEDHEFPVGEVGQAHDAEDHGHADAQEGIEAPQKDAVDRQLQRFQCFHLLSALRPTKELWRAVRSAAQIG